MGDNGHYVKVDQEQSISLGSNGAVTFRRIGGIVLVVFSGTVPGASGSWSRVSLGTLEEGLSPVSSTNVVLSSQGIASASRCEIGVDGAVYYVNSGLGAITEETYMRGSSAYVAAR